MLESLFLGLERDCEDLQGTGGEKRADSGGERGRDWETDARLFKIETQTCERNLIEGKYI